MTKRWFVVGGAAVVVVAAALYVGLVVYPDARLKAALREAQQFLPPGTTLSYRNASYSALTGRASLSGVTLKDAGRLGLEVTIDTVLLDRPSLSLASDWQRAEANRAAVTPTTSLPVAAAISCTGIVIRARTKVQDIGSLQVEGLRLYPWALLHPGVPSWAEVQALLAKRSAPASLAGFVPLLRFEAAWTLGVAYSGLSAKDITGSFEIPATRNHPAHAGNFSAAHFDDSGNDRGVFERRTLEQTKFDLGPRAGTMRFERIAIAGANMRKPLSKMIEATSLTPALLNGLELGRVEAAGMTITPPGGVSISLGTFALSKIAFVGGVPVSGALAWNGLHLTRAEMPSPRARLAFDQLGIGSMTISLDAAYDWDLKASSFSFHDFLLKVAELGSLSLSASLTDLAPGLVGLGEARLAHAALRYTDASLVRRALDAAAGASHVDPAAFRQQLIGMLQRGIGEVADKPALADVVKAIVAFLDAPHSLTATVSPPAPVPLATLEHAADMTPSDLVSRLGLVVTANR